MKKIVKLFNRFPKTLFLAAIVITFVLSVIAFNVLLTSAKKQALDYASAHARMAETVAFQARKQAAFSEEQQKQLFLDTVRLHNDRTPEKDYFYVMTTNSDVLISPEPEEVGKNRNDIYKNNPKSLKIVEDVVRVAKNKGSGELVYKWKEPGKDSNRYYVKVSYIVYLPYWDYIILVGKYLNESYIAIFRTLLLFSTIVFLVILFSINIIKSLRFKGMTSLMEAISSPSWIVDKRNNVIFMNPAYKKFFGIRRRFKRLKSTSVFTTEVAKDLKRAEQECFETHAIVRIDHEINHLNKDVSIKIIVFPLFDSLGELNNLGCYIMDITDEKMSEKQRMDFITLISHELRTPLTAIFGSLKILTTMYKSQFSEKVNELLILAIRNSRKLKSLIDNILNISKLDANKLELDIRNVNIVPTLGSTIEELKSYGSEYDVHLNYENGYEEIRVDVDVERFVMCFSNLISNAIKYSKRNASVDVKTEILPNEKLKISIKNYDAYVPPEALERLFKKYSQADTSTTLSKKGTGLGLYISQQLIEQMNGEVGMLSDPKVTETFIIFKISNI